jgi:hypothetical protein
MWLRIRSWHVFDRWSTVDSAVAITMCGLRKWLADGTLNAEPDLDEKTCERCFRIRESRDKRGV